MPQHFQQSYDIGTLVAAWATKLQQAWHSLRLPYALGEVQTESMTVLEAADKYDALRKTFGVNHHPPSTYYRAQRRNLHDRRVIDPTMTMGWSRIAAGDADVVSQEC